MYVLEDRNVLFVSMFWMLYSERVGNVGSRATVVPYLEDSSRRVDGGKLYVETYGCQMNVNDMEIVLAIMKDSGYTEIVQTPEESDIIFINTCAIRENAEHKIWHRLNYFKHLKSRCVN